jgi:hypothetical protein
MKKFLTLLASVAALGLSLSFGAAYAADAPAGITPQQSKMGTCNKDAEGKKGEERKAFMKECLSAKPAAEPAKPATQQQKMKTCNADAKTKALKGDERKAFMKDCLSNK